MGQTPVSPTGAAHSYSTGLGFTYDLPGEWEVIYKQGSLSQAKERAAQNSASEEESKGLPCVQMGLTARHRGSVIVDVALPFDCFGQNSPSRTYPVLGRAHRRE